MVLDINAQDIANIEAAIAAGGKIWDNELLKDFKRKIKTYNRYKQNEQCCYCRKNFAGEFNMVIDIEHILPKKHFGHLMFATYNLSISCKRCNMNIKKEDISFLTNTVAVNANPTDTNLYKIIHPNFDDYFAHLNYLTETINDKKIIKYTVLANSSKGQFTYGYFQLNELEIDSFNKAQGLKEAEELSEIIEPKIAQRIENLIKTK
jgi:uncharacterized protein (TIGR02646 family)